MKIILIISNLLLATLSTAQEPATIYNITYPNKSAQYYQTQIKLWKGQLDASPSNASAWLNYFMAHYALYQKEVLTKEEILPLQAQLEQAFPNSFETYYTAYLVNNNITTLEKAYAQAPQRHEAYAPLVAHYHQTGEMRKVKALCKKWLASSVYATDILHWSYNALVGLDQNAILLTDGDHYTYPLYLLQYGKQLRTDVKVLSLDWLTNPSYRRLVFQQLAIPILENNTKEAIITHLTRHVSTTSLYFGASIPPQTMEGHEEELYIIGLAFQYSNQALNNLALLQENYENKFLLDYIKVNLDPVLLDKEVVAEMNLKYLPAFLLLHEYYEEQQNWEAAQIVKNLSVKIAEAAHQKEKLQQYLSGNVTQTPYTVTIPYEILEKRMQPMDYHYNLYVSEIEVTNADYELFLTDLLKKKAYEALQRYKVHKTDWRALLPSEAQDIPHDIVYQYGHPNDGDHPVQNISHESAVAYCAWLTKGYNSLDEKKKKYQKVQFRLPTEKEWEAMASANSPYLDGPALEMAQTNKYVWGGKYFKNAKGCYLFNINTAQEPPCLTCGDDKTHVQDGIFFTAKADTYFPTVYGAYNVLGNVAEMVEEKGIARGGSWFHSPYESQIYSVNTYQKPEPYVGFRIFMEVLEEKNGGTKKKKTVAPPNTIHLNGKLYMDQSEITNIDWKEYQYWMKKNDPENWANTLLDTNAWLQIDSNYTPIIQQYHAHSAYDQHPVVGMSHQQAKDYCQWRSKVVNEMLRLNPNKDFQQVAYRLPTEKEWEYAASTGLNKSNFPYGIDVDAHKKNAHRLFNFDHEPQTPLEAASSATPAPTNSYLPNAWGFYNFFGNVAEMVEEEGISKGGSWQHSSTLGRIEKNIPYDGTHPWLGFRCICELR